MRGIAEQRHPSAPPRFECLVLEELVPANISSGHRPDDGAKRLVETSAQLMRETQRVASDASDLVGRQ
jgi:hypothetical protein